MENLSAKVIDESREEIIENEKLVRPKKPISSYLLFMQDQKAKRQTIKLKEVSQQWNNASSEERAVKFRKLQ